MLSSRLSKIAVALNAMSIHYSQKSRLYHLLPHQVFNNHHYNYDQWRLMVMDGKRQQLFKIQIQISNNSMKMIVIQCKKYI
jgi:hypothetical protein